MKFLFLLITVIISSIAPAQIWSPVGTGIDSTVTRLFADNGNLYAGGTFSHAGSKPANNVAIWNGTNWNNMGGGVNGLVWGLTGDSIIYAAGWFDSAEGKPANSVAAWNGTSWQSLTTSVSNIAPGGAAQAATMFQGKLIVAGTFDSINGVAMHQIAQWDGHTWSNFGCGIYSFAWTLTPYDSVLYVGGTISAAGCVRMYNIVQWNGTLWSGLGQGLSASTSIPQVDASCMFQDTLYVGGDINYTGPKYVGNIVKWTGTTWDSVGTGGINGFINSMVVYNGSLIVGGGFTNAGGVAANNIARWDGKNWHPLGSGLSGQVLGLAVYNGDLYAGGSFDTAGGKPAMNIARWHDTTTAINQIASKKETIQVFPNPSLGMFTFHFHSNCEASIHIYNALGQEVWNHSLRQAQGDFSVDLNNESKGIYLYRVVSVNGDLLSSGKLILQ